MNCFEKVAQILKNEGIEWISCFPENQIINEAAKVGIRTVAFRHERGAVMAADGYSRVQNRQNFGVVAVQSQAGAENSMGGIAQSFADNVPILVLVKGVSTNQISVTPNFSAVEKYRGWAKQVEAVYAPSQINNVMRRAFHALRNGKPGPVVVELTEDICEQEVPENAEIYNSPKISKIMPDKELIIECAQKLLEAQNPMIWSGAGVISSEATNELIKLAELLSIPVFTTMPGKSSFDERHPLFLGSGCGTTTKAAHHWLVNSDLILALGTSLTRTPYGQKIPSGKYLIHNTINSNDINKDENVDLGLLGDTKLTIIEIILEIKNLTKNNNFQNNFSILKEIKEKRENWLNEWNATLNSDEVPISYYRVVNELNKNLNLEESIVTHDAGAPRDSMVPFFQATLPNSYIGWGKTTHLGFGLPLIIGAKMAKKNKFCINIMGEGAFGMSGMDIETAVRSEIPITTIVLNNKSMATYTGKTQGKIGKEAREIFGVSKMSGNYSKIADGLGAHSITVTKPSELSIAIQKAKELNNSGVTVLIEVIAKVEEKRSRF